MKHHIAIVATILALAANAEYIRQATETYPGGGSGGADTNTVKEIINAEVGGTNTLVHTPQIANLATTNYVRSALGSVAYVTNTANGAFVDADLNARVVIPATSWNPAEIITRNGEAYGRCGNVRWESSKWICDTWVKMTETSSWIFLQSYDMTGPGASDFSATTLTFPNNLGTTTRVVGANYLTKIADTNYVQAVAVATTNTAFAAASAYADTSANKAFVDATNSTSRIALHGAIIYGDLTVETHSGWYPLYGYYSDTRRIGNPTWASSSQRWYCRMQEWNGTGWANIGGGWATGPGASDPDGVDINYPNGTKAHRYIYDYAVDKLATTNDLAKIGNGLTTNDVRGIVTEFVNTGVCWSKPNLWCLDFQLGYTASVIGNVSFETNYNAITEKKTFGYVYGNYADLYTTVYDEYRMDPVVVQSYACLTPGGTINAAGRLMTESNGVYRCKAVDTRGVASTVDVPIQSSLTEKKVNDIYVADVPGSIRKVTNDAAIYAMTNATFAGTGTYEKVTYNIWNFFTQPVWAETQAEDTGWWKAFALGTTVMASAAHYGSHSRIYQTVGTNVVLLSDHYQNLRSWAITNGWSEAELAKIPGISDIMMIPIDEGTIPVDDLPYLMSEAQLKATYGTLEGLQCWACTQSFKQPIPLVYTTEHGTYWTQFDKLSYWISGKPFPWREDMEAAYNALGTEYPIHSGDSGHPTYFKDYAGRYVLTSHFLWGNGGPDYIKALPVIEAYVTAHGGVIRKLP